MKNLWFLGNFFQPTYTEHNTIEWHFLGGQRWSKIECWLGSFVIFQSCPDQTFPEGVRAPSPASGPVHVSYSELPLIVFSQASILSPAQSSWCDMVLRL